MPRRSGKREASLFSREQTERVILASGGTIAGEVDTDWIIFCPYHSNTRTPAAEIDKENGTFFCFGCRKIASLMEYVMTMTGSNEFGALRLIKKYEQDINFVDVLDKKLMDKPDYVEFDNETVTRLHEQAKASERARDYFAGRGIHDLSTYKLGYSEAQDMVTVPQFDPSGTICVGWVARSIEGKDFKNTPKLPKSKILFNLHRVRSSEYVYVVESSFDAIRLHQEGVPAVATLGANVSNKQCDLMKKYFNQVYVIPDTDEAGKMMGEKVLTQLGSRGIIIGLPDRYKDVGDLTTEDINKLHNKIQNPLTLLGENT